ncbi:MAG: hypothetical protein ABIH28_01875 [archaeon]
MGNDEKPRVDLKYGEGYFFFIENEEKLIEKEKKYGLYIGNTPYGMGRIVCAEEDPKGYKKPVIFGFDLRDVALEEKLIKGDHFNKLSLTNKEKLFALEILTKKGL